MSAIQFEFIDGTVVSLGVTKLPNRKQSALYRRRGANIDVLAYFRDDGCAEEFARLLNIVIEKTNAKVSDGADRKDRS